MKTIAMQAALRERTGTRDTKATRRSGRVPAVIYDNAKATHVHVDYKEALQVFYTKDTYIINLGVEGEQMDVIVRDADFHPVKEKLQHIEFLRVSGDNPVVLQLPVTLTGKAVGVAKGGKLTTKLRRLKVKGVPSQLPEEIVVDVTDLDLGGTIKVGEAGIDIEGLEVVTSTHAAVASVEIPRALRSAQESAKAGEGEEVAAE
ncbi:MAG: 50S ribosomal protein L25 [Bacteroidota bacterium]